MDAGTAAELVTLAEITAARGVAGAVAKHTPVVSSVALSSEFGQPVVLKAESLQRTGSFKIRGAMNKLASLGSDAKAGVTAGSAGNHAQSLAFAAKYFGVPCEIFVPAGAPISKIEACRSYGATVIEQGASVDESIADARELADRDGKAFCHPYDDAAVDRRPGNARSRARRGPRRPQLRGHPASAAEGSPAVWPSPSSR